MAGVVEDHFGSWTVQWRPEGFSIRATGPAYDFFRFNRIILPVEIVTSGFFGGLDRIRLRVDPAARVEILMGVSTLDLQKFKRRVSGEVVSAVRTSPFGCADCAAEAGRDDAMWDGTPCPSCREYYCRNAICLRRLKVDVLRDGSLVCRLCGMENVHVPTIPVSTPSRRARTWLRISDRIPARGRLLPH